MAQDDYFVVAYRILSYLYECFKSGEQADPEFFGPKALGIGNGCWCNTMESMSDKGYIKGISVINSIGGSPSIKIVNVKITQDGIEFLQDNSKIAKAKAFLKTVKDIVPGF